MHDRRIEGTTHTFGNAGGLYRNAMTWWDHQTNSIWSQPTGTALGGELQGTRLNGLPFQLTTWANWLTTHPDTKVMANDIEKLGAFRDRFSTEFLVGVELSGIARAYPFVEILSAGLIEDRLGGIPILVWGEGEEYQVFLRQVGEQELHFELRDGKLYDSETGSRWDPRLGLAREGILQGEALQQIPSFSIWESSWYDFFPEGDIYLPD